MLFTVPSPPIAFRSLIESHIVVCFCYYNTPHNHICQ
nr:MAG TPA: hypothetical protein [Caudoviricetes sp.]